MPSLQEVFKRFEADEKRNRNRRRHADKLLTVLNFSGGKQSSCILWMVLRGDLPRPVPFIVLTADPGMEDSRTYEYVAMMQGLCKEAGIEAYTVPGPNLYEDLISYRERGVSWMDHPAYWVLKEDGSVGRMRQQCTKAYKVKPMDRFLRGWMEENLGIRRKATPPAHCVVKWIGFSYNETCRIKPSRERYIRFEYPLVDTLMADDDVLAYFEDNGLPVPPRSVCTACFANTPRYFRDMMHERPQDWERTCLVDDYIRCMRAIQITQGDVFITKDCVPLREMPTSLFLDLPEEEGPGEMCESGYCFT